MPEGTQIKFERVVPQKYCRRSFLETWSNCYCVYIIYSIYWEAFYYCWRVIYCCLARCLFLSDLFILYLLLIRKVRTGKSVNSSQNSTFIAEYPLCKLGWRTFCTDNKMSARSWWRLLTPHYTFKKGEKLRLAQQDLTDIFWSVQKVYPYFSKGILSNKKRNMWGVGRITPVSRFPIYDPMYSISTCPHKRGKI